MVLETSVKFCLTELDFLEKNNFVRKMGEMGQKQVFLKFIEKFSHLFFLSLFYKEIAKYFWVSTQILYFETV